MDTRLRSPTGRDTGKLLHCPLTLSKMQVTYRFTWPKNATRHSNMVILCLGASCDKNLRWTRQLDVRFGPGRWTQWSSEAGACWRPHIPKSDQWSLSLISLEALPFQSVCSFCDVV